MVAYTEVIALWKFQFTDIAYLMSMILSKGIYSCRILKICIDNLGLTTLENGQVKVFVLICFRLMSMPYLHLNMSVENGIFLRKETRNRDINIDKYLLHSRRQFWSFQRVGSKIGSLNHAS